MTMATTSLYTQRNPFAAERTGGYRITPAGAPKDCQHHVVSLAGSGIAYKPGDALGVLLGSCKSAARIGERAAIERE